MRLPLQAHLFIPNLTTDQLLSEALADFPIEVMSEGKNSEGSEPSEVLTEYFHTE